MINNKGVGAVNHVRIIGTLDIFLRIDSAMSRN